MDRGGTYYWCHQCQRTVLLNTNTNEIACPICNGGFIEAVEQQQQHHYQPVRGHVGNPQVIGSPESVLHMLQSILLGRANRNTSEGGALHRIVLPVPNSILGSMMLGSPDNVEIAFEGNFNPQGLFRDMFEGGDQLDQVIQHLMENDPNKYGAPPASTSAIQGLPTVRISQEHLGTDSSMCAVCKDEFEIGTEVRQMPCSHLYHGDCLLPWLQQHNSCPVCRFELPTDDSDYEAQKQAGQSSGSAPNERASGSRLTNRASLNIGNVSAGAVNNNSTRFTRDSSDTVTYTFPAGQPTAVNNNSTSRPPRDSGDTVTYELNTDGGRMLVRATPGNNRSPRETSQEGRNTRRRVSMSSLFQSVLNRFGVGNSPRSNHGGDRTDSDDD